MDANGLHSAILPDVLVCGAGGTLGEAWMRGVLHGLEDATGLDFRDCGGYLGTSAGSIVVATLAAGRRPHAGDAAARAWADAAPQEPAPGTAATRGPAARLARAVAAPVAPLGLAVAAPGGRALRAAALAAMPEGRRSLDRVAAYIERLGARFDGRLRVAAVDVRSGARVLFGAPGAPAARASDAVAASCAIPGWFAPVPIGDRRYVDGGVWSPVNLDASPARRGERVLALVPTAGAIRAFRALTTASLAAESLALKARGASVRTIAPDAASAAALGPNPMDARRSDAVLAAAYAQGRRLGA